MSGEVGRVIRFAPLSYRFLAARCLPSSNWVFYVNLREKGIRKNKWLPQMPWTERVAQAKVLLAHFLDVWGSSLF